jgi:hypothetical protein
MKRGLLALIIILLTLGMNACKWQQSIKNNKIRKEWIGKQILFPSDYQCNLLGKNIAFDTCAKLLYGEYKILLYIDSTGCTDCIQHLFVWRHLRQEADSLFPKKLTFLFFLQQKNTRELQFLLQRNRMDFPVFIDINNQINQLNNFPSQTEFQCFLLDKNNRVLAVGNPVLNPPNLGPLQTSYSGKQRIML